MKKTKSMTLNFGPQHPAAHGVLRLILELEGETVERSKPVIGYLHTGMEKTAETLSYTQGSTNVTRMDYASPLFTELAFSLAVEKLLEIGMVHRIESMNAFVACQQEKCDEKNNEINLFTICEICGSVQELLNRGLKNIVKSLSKDNNFLLKNSVLELNGVCSKCKD